MQDEQVWAKATVSALIEEIDRGAADSVAATVDTLTEPRHAALLRAVVGELLELSASGVSELAGYPSADATYMIEVCDGEGNLADIDKVDPPQRAVIRALLARLAGHPEDMAIQLDIALSNADRDDAAEVLATALLWAMDTLPQPEPES